MILDVAVMNIPAYPAQLHKLIKEKMAPKSAEVIAPDENKLDPNDTEAEARKTLKNKIGPIDTEAEAREFNKEKEILDPEPDNSSPHP
jgi:hypothetical protein